jgi:2',3'-cyclic-nucleotide 2'-phosphodiesterase (5'-nucleotidase family)
MRPHRILSSAVVFLLAVACRSTPTEVAAPTGEIVLLHTSDEHGWLEPAVQDGWVFGGPAVMATMWAEREGRSPDTHLVLSGGDATLGGAAISQWFDGIPAVEVMNTLGYDAAVPGNHEFDLGVDAFEQMASAADFPWLAANIEQDDGRPTDLVTGAQLFPVGDIDVGVIGVAYHDTPGITSAGATDGLVFTPAIPAVESHARALRNDGAELVVVLSHECSDVATEYAAQLDAPIDLWLTGHCHRVETVEVDGLPFVGSGDSWAGYSRIAIAVEDGEVVSVDVEFQDVGWSELLSPLAEPDPSVQAVIDHWSDAIDEVLSVPIGHTNTGIARSWQMGNWFTDAYLEAIPDADFTMVNRGGLRADIPPGPMTLEHLVDVAPFENRLVVVEVTGAQLHQYLAENVDRDYAAGFTWSVTDSALDVAFPDGTPLAADDVVYRIAMTDYVAQNPNLLFAGLPIVRHTGLHYRDPVRDWTEALQTTESDPLEAYIDPAPRGPI